MNPSMLLTNMSFRMPCGGHVSFGGTEGVNLGLKDNHFVGGIPSSFKMVIIPHEDRQIIVSQISSHVTDVNHVQMLVARLAYFPTVHQCRRDQ